jgi:hypothetical protein
VKNKAHLKGMVLGKSTNSKISYRRTYLWCMLIIPALWRLRQEDYKFKDSLNYIARCCLRKASSNNKNN